jgi:hypothetical protein
VFGVAVVLRGLPELLIPQYPVGYETITYYAPIMLRFHEMSFVAVVAETFQAGSLFYVLMWLATAVSGAHAFLLLKVTGPLLYGCLAVSFFAFLRRGLGWRWKMAFVAALLLVFQVAALRIGWDRFRTVLALVFVFAGLSLSGSKFRFKWLLVSGLGVLAVLSREYVGVMLLVGFFGFALLERRETLVSFGALVPPLLVFVGMVSPWLWQSWVAEVGYAMGNYAWVVQDVLSIFVVCYLALTLFVLKGFRRDSLLDPVFGLLLCGSLSVVVVPWVAVPGYQRWLMLLVFPLSVYAVLGLERFRLLEKSHFKKLGAVLMVFMVVGVGYSTGVFSYVGRLPNSYVAVDLVQSSIGWGQVEDVKTVLRWLDENAVSGSGVLVEECFYGWTSLYLERANVDVWVLPYGAARSPTSALSEALWAGYSSIYLVWFAERSVSGFEVVYSWDAVSVFQYSGGV